MRVTTIHAPGDIRLEERPDPTITEGHQAIVRTVRSCICGSDLWPYRGPAEDIPEPRPIGHEAIGVVEAVGADCSTTSVGDFVIIPFCHCDNTCAHCRAGMTSGCVNTAFTQGGQGELVTVHQADGSLVAVEQPADDDLPHLLALTDVMATGWHAAVSSRVIVGSTAVVVGDGAVGLCGVLAAREMGAERIIAMSRHEPRQELARHFGATDIVAERGEEGEQRVMDLTDGVGADSVLECVGTGQAMSTAIAVARPGATVGFVGVPHGVDLPIREMFSRNVGVAGGMAPVRTYLPTLLDLVRDGRIDPGRVFDLALPLDKVAEGYTAMDEREAIKVMLTP